MREICHDPIAFGHIERYCPHASVPPAIEADLEPWMVRYPLSFEDPDGLMATAARHWRLRASRQERMPA